MSMQHHGRSPIIPIRYSGYRACSSCHHQFYTGTTGETTCRLCRVEQTVRKTQEQRRETERDRRGFVPIERSCEQCGSVYLPHVKARNSRFCSRACKERERSTRSRTCAVCNDPFRPARMDQVVCGKQKCRTERDRQLQAVWRQRRKAAKV